MSSHDESEEKPDLELGHELAIFATHEGSNISVAADVRISRLELPKHNAGEVGGTCEEYDQEGHGYKPHAGGRGWEGQYAKRYRLGDDD